MDECDYVDCSQVPFFHDGLDTTLEIYGSGEKGDDLLITFKFFPKISCISEKFE